MSETVLDTSGLSCPLPVLKARKAMRAVAPGGRLRLLATDPASLRDVPAFCEAAGFELVEVEEEGGLFRFLLRKPDPGSL